MVREELMKENKSKFTKNFPEFIWCVEGIDQHGEEISFDMHSLEDAEKHEARFNRLGGKVRIIAMKFNSSYAGWLPIDKEELRKRLYGQN